MRGRKPELANDRNALAIIPGAPGWLSKHAKAEWRRVMPDLTKRRILTQADLGSLENYCIASGQVREMERLLAKEGHVVETARGPRAHPAFRIQSDAMTRARLLAAELGLTPVSRSRPSIHDDGGDDEHSSDLGI
jgi:P27 family predicted phage terminase small subunit